MVVRQLRDAIEIDAPPEAIWEWLSGLSEHYTQWHPDHVSAHWERGKPNQVRSILEAVEDLGGHRDVLRFEITEANPPHGFAYRMRGPISMLLPGGDFTIVANDGGSLFAATISYRFGWVTERLFRSRMAALAQHMKEEGESLKQIVESIQ